MGLLDAPPSLSMYCGHTGGMSCLRCHKKYTKREPLTTCLQPQKMRPNPERRSEKVLIIPENKTRPHLFPSHLSLPRCCSISGRMLMPAAFLWCVTRSKTKLRHKHFLDPLILTLYVQYWSSTCQIVFAYVSHLTLTGPWYSRMLKLFAKVKHT